MGAPHFCKQADMTTPFETEILAAEKQRCDAMVANSAEALADLLDPRLHFTHSNAVVDSKDAVLSKMRAGRIVYEAAGWPEQKVTQLSAETALLTGRMVVDVAVEGNKKRLVNQVITVWSKTGGKWRLIAFQSTPVPA